MTVQRRVVGLINRNSESANGPFGHVCLTLQMLSCDNKGVKYLVLALPNRPELTPRWVGGIVPHLTQVPRAARMAVGLCGVACVLAVVGVAAARDRLGV